MATYKPSEFAELVGVTVKTLQNWDNAGKFKANRTPTNRRYYTDDHIKEFAEGRRSALMS